MRKPFDLLNEFARFGLERDMSLAAEESRREFVDHVARSMDEAMSDPILLHGQRTESMFEAMVASLGEFRLFKREDFGRVHSQDAIRAPDFRIVLRDGRQWLVEVKNVYLPDPLEQTRQVMDRAYHEEMRSYAETTGGELRLAIYWARWSVWTLVNPDRFLNDAGGVEVSMEGCIPFSELGYLGDRTVATRAPLVLRFEMDSERTYPLDDDGTFQCVIGGYALRCEDREIVDAAERALAWDLIQYGDWRDSEAEPVLEDRNLVAIEFRWEPEESSSDGFDIIGTFSRMFSRYYAGLTLEDGKVVRLRAPARPEWFAPLLDREYVGKAMPVWRFQQTVPAIGPVRRDASPAPDARLD